MASPIDDFSFPATIAAQPPRFVASPPTWWRSASSNAFDEDLKEKEVQDGSINPDDDQEEEKMDILWEDLNEETTRNGGKTGQSSDMSSPGKEVHMSCVKVRALKLTKADGYIFSRKKPSVLVFIKLLKKVFVMQNSRRSIKKRACVV